MLNSVKILMTVAVSMWLAGSLSAPAQAQLELYKDYNLSESIWVLTTVKADPNMEEEYLEGIRATWAAANEVAKELGQIEDYGVMMSDLPTSGDFNIILGIKLSSSAEMQPDRKEYEAFMKAWGDANREKTRSIAKDYPSMREITGTYIMREVSFVAEKDG